MSFIFFILFLAISIIAATLLFVFGIIRTIFGTGKRKNEFSREDTFNNKESGNPFKQEENKPKIFSKKEGEYVDFEEIKD